MIIFNFKKKMTFSHLKYIKNLSKFVMLTRSFASEIGKSPSLEWPASRIRRTFIDYFQNTHNHIYVASSSVLPQKGDGVYFTNAGMNQGLSGIDNLLRIITEKLNFWLPICCTHRSTICFPTESTPIAEDAHQCHFFKPLFLGTADAKSAMSRYKRVVNSQKCIRVGGKHNDLDDVGRDLYHHTFFEMLGSWSFSDYFKKEACEMALDLLINVYGISMDRLYVTYFSGDDALGIPPDETVRQIWTELGFPASRVLAFGMADNFWEMGQTGPCGPCTEIHYDHVGGRCASSLVNTGSHDVIELWNLVFMQFDRQIDGHLVPLKNQHVDTGLGLERLAAVLQNTVSNYDTDLFTPLFHHIHQNSGLSLSSYKGLTGSADIDGVDAAYRIVADHARMMTVSIADGLMPSKRNLGHKLRDIIHRCLKNCNSVLGTPPGFLASLVDVVVESLGDAFPETRLRHAHIKSTVSEAEKRYIKSLETQQRNCDVLLRELFDITTITDHQLRWLMENCGDVITERPEIQALIEDRGIHARIDERVSLNKLNTMSLLSQRCVDHLMQLNCHSTDDHHKYSYHRLDDSHRYVMSDLTSRACALVVDGHPVDRLDQSTGDDSTFGVVTMETNFYAESGGQASDVGTIVGQNGEFEVVDVQSYRGYVIHKGHCTRGHMTANENVTMLPSMVGHMLAISLGSPPHLQASRMACTYNHTATHLLNHALVTVFGQDVRQCGSSITPDKLTFDFTGTGDRDIKTELSHVESLVLNVIRDKLTVYHTHISHESAMRIPQIRYLRTQNYPDTVRVVSIGGALNDLPTSMGDNHSAGISAELCGGTHAENAGDIGSFCITKCTQIAQGTTRITAVTHDHATTAWDNHKRARQALTDLKSRLLAGFNCQEAWQMVKEIDKLLAQPLYPRSQHGRKKAELRGVKNKIQRRQNASCTDDLCDEIMKKLSIDATESFHCWQLDFTAVSQVVSALRRASVERPTSVVASFNNTTTAVLYLPKKYMTSDADTIIRRIASLSGSRSGENPHAPDMYVVILKGSNRQEDLTQSIEAALTNAVIP